MNGGFAGMLQAMQAEGLRKLSAKVPSWAGRELEIPASLNLQQCSGEIAARYKASLIPEGARVADLTGGLGVDSWAFSLKASAVWYNERDNVLCGAVERNFGLLSISNVLFNCYDIGAELSGWQEALSEFGPDVIYLDPARRGTAGRKLFLLEECSPDVVSLMPLLTGLAPTVMVKVSPMADITMLRRRLEAYLSHIHVIGTGGECKELLCVCSSGASFSGVVLAENGQVFNPSCVAEAETGQRDLLFVPSASMVKSGLGPGMGMMPYDGSLAHFGKYYQVIEDLPFASSVLKALGRRYPQAEVTAKGVGLSSEQLRTKIKTKPGGPVHIFACVLGGERRLIISCPYHAAG
ncbi:MAG: hypothetical protein IKH11_05615 [Bacteroidales bacterium]|nr:hypothetical protein [Bacteroidales bacterium]